MPITDEAANQEVSEWERAIARRWAKVFRALLDEGNEDARAIVAAWAREVGAARPPRHRSGTPTA